jgi:hypothetical protein
MIIYVFDIELSPLSVDAIHESGHGDMITLEY